MALLDGVPLVRRVYDQAIRSGFPVYVLTDDEGIADLFNEDVVFIDHTDYESGTERCAGAVNQWRRLDQYSNFINVQGDMPDVTPEIIHAVQIGLESEMIYTVYTEMSDKQRSDPNTVKMIHNGKRALWFGRGFVYGDQHLGVYGYRRGALLKYPILEKLYAETVERLEQLRWYQSEDIHIGVTRVEFNGVEINTPGDLEEWHARRKSMGDHRAN